MGLTFLEWVFYLTALLAAGFAGYMKAERDFYKYKQKNHN